MGTRFGEDHVEWGRNPKKKRGTKGTTGQLRSLCLPNPKSSEALRPRSEVFGLSEGRPMLSPEAAVAPHRRHGGASRNSASPLVKWTFLCLPSPEGETRMFL